MNIIKCASDRRSPLAVVRKCYTKTPACQGRAPM